MAAPLLGPPGLTGRTLGHYRIGEKIGAGGMGEVYRAHDQHLDREVALKVLPPGLLVDEQARKRFRKEALALSKLNHPGIETVYDFDAQEGMDFLVMEYVPGSTLSERLAAGPVAESEVERLGLQLVEALEAAHAHGVIHRDLKPANLRLTPHGRLKVLDFGLAKLLQPADPSEVTESLSQTRGPAGTLPYMAPEQLQGKPVDARADLYAAGTVLYEMATGRLPFSEKLSTALADDILHRPPPPPGRLRPELSPRLEEIILKCLEKDPANRYQSANELEVDLRRLSTPPSLPQVRPSRARVSRRRMAAGAVALVVVVALLAAFDVGGLRSRLRPRPAAPQIQSLAVLPLANLSRDPEQDYFADGMTEALITDLSKIRALKVISRTSIMRYKGSTKPLPEIARELNVDGVIEGSVLRAGDRVRITAQLIYAPSDTHLWAESYERDLRDVLALQEEVATAIAGQVRVVVTPQERQRLASGRSVDPEAYEVYLRGRQLWSQRTEASVNQAGQLFQQAIQKDPNYAAAYAGLADTYSILSDNGYLAPREGYPQARAAAQKALALDDSLAEAHTSLAMVLINYDWDWTGAEREFRRAIELNPGYATAHDAYAFLVLSNQGRHEEALTEVQEARRLDPLAPSINRHVGFVLVRAGQYQHAQRELQQALQLYPNDAWTHFYLGRLYLLQPGYGDAVGEFRRMLELSPKVPDGMAGLVHALVVADRRKEAQRVLLRLLELERQRHLGAVAVAESYLALGDRERALAWLQTAYTRREKLTGLRRGRTWDPLRSDPRFLELERRVGPQP